MKHKESKSAWKEIYTVKSKLLKKKAYCKHVTVWFDFKKTSVNTVIT